MFSMTMRQLKENSRDVQQQMYNIQKRFAARKHFAHWKNTGSEWQFWLNNTEIDSDMSLIALIQTVEDYMELHDV